jgi:hypothetical protein
LDRIGPCDHCALPQGNSTQTGTALFCGSPVSPAFVNLDALEQRKLFRLSTMQRAVARIPGSKYETWVARQRQLESRLAQISH